MPEKIKNTNSVLNRIRLAKVADGTIKIELTKSKKILEALKLVYGESCVRCKESDADTIDHVIPKSKGGRDHVDNYQPMCKKCNNDKGSFDTDYRPIDENLKERVRAALGINHTMTKEPAPVKKTQQKKHVADQYMDMPKNISVKPKKLGKLHPYWNPKTMTYEYYSIEFKETPSHLVKPIW